MNEAAGCRDRKSTLVLACCFSWGLRREAGKRESPGHFLAVSFSSGGKELLAVWPPPRSLDLLFSSVVERESKKNVEGVSPHLIVLDLRLRRVRISFPFDCIESDGIESKKIKNPQTHPGNTSESPIRDRGRGFESITRTSISNPARPAGHSLLDAMHISYSFILYIISTR